MEKRRKEREEAHLYMDIQVATEENFRAHQGFDIIPWKSDMGTPAHPKSIRFLRAMTVGDFLSFVAGELGLDPQACRPWVMVSRQNGTVRPDQPILFNDMSLEDASNKYGTKTVPFRIWLEQTDERDEAGKPVWKDAHVDLHGVVNNRTVLLFLKHFDTDAQTLLGVSHFYAPWYEKVADLSPIILQIMGWAPGTPFKLFEVSVAFCIRISAYNLHRKLNRT